MKWNRWILELLPGRRRTLMVYALCVVLVSPVVKLYGEFVGWRAKMLVKTGGTPQVCMLRRIIKDELGIDVLIEEGNGKPTDFIIKTSFVNIDMERRLFALLDRYKLAGKSYGYENAEILYDNRWTAYLCEKIRTNTITITFYWNGKPGDGEIRKISIQSELPVTSDLNINIVFFYLIDGESLAPFDFKLLTGSSSFEIETWAFNGYKEIKVTPEGDEEYDYVLKIIDVV